MTDVIVIGGGPAGVSAAIYLKRFKKNVIILMKDYGTLEKVDYIENYYGIINPISGTDLIDAGIKQAERLGIEVYKEEVTNITYTGNFLVKTNKAEYEGKTVLLATGANRTKLKIPGFNDFVGKGISFCSICDGFLYRNKKLGLVGTGEYMLEELEVLKNFTNEITVFTNGKELEVELNDVKVVKDPLIKISGTESIEQVQTDKETFFIDGMFIAVGTASASDFALKLGAYIEKNNIVVDKDFMTNIPGLFAAGDCIGGLLQISKAVSDGAHVAMTMNKYIKSL